MKTTHFRRLCRACIVRIAILVSVISSATASRSFALDDSKKPTGDNHAAAHAFATGAGVGIVVIEPGGTAANPANNLGTRLKAEYSFVGLGVGGMPIDNSAMGDNHSTLVADVAAGDDATFTGVAKGADVYFMDFSNPGATGAGMASNDGDDPAHDNAFNSYRGAIGWLGTPVAGQAGADAYKNHPALRLFNNSWGPAYETDDNGDNRFARFVDWYSRTNDALFVGAAGNDGNKAGERINWPWDHYNGLTVGALERNGAGEYRARVNFSEYWLNGDDGTAPDIRGKPDIVAPGHQISDGKSYGGANQNGTSFATPHVTGTAALVMQRGGLDLPGPSNRNHLAVKAIVMNSAHKRSAVKPENGFQLAQDNAGTAAQPSDKDYLNGGALRLGTSVSTAATTADWTPADWNFNGNLFQTTSPLDDEQGVGSLDAGRAMVQVDGGEQLRSTYNPAGVRPIGWDRDAMVFGGGENIYPLNFSIAAGTFITTTLTWDRIINETNASGGTVGTIDTGDTYALAGTTGLPDLDLRIYYKGVRIASSISIVDNVEHLHIPVWQAGNPFDYEIRVDYGNMNGTNANLVNYGLAWWTAAVPEPATLVLTLFGCAFAITRRHDRQLRA